MLPCGASGGDAQVRLELGEVQHLRAVGEHRGRGLAGIEPARIHFPDEGDEIGFDSPRLMQKLGQSAEERVVRDLLERARVFHADNIGRGSSTSWDRACATLRPTIAFEASGPIAQPVVRRRASRASCGRHQPSRPNLLRRPVKGKMQHAEEIVGSGGVASRSEAATARSRVGTTTEGAHPPAPGATLPRVAATTARHPTADLAV